MSEVLSPNGAEGGHSRPELFRGGEASSFQAFHGHDPKPDFDLIQPRAMIGSEVEDDSLLIRFEPLSALLSFF